jgi:GT2 family glycosyltransferase
MAESAPMRGRPPGKDRLPLVYSVVLTYNNFADTDECVRSLAAQDCPEHRIIVVDNGSSDGSLGHLRDVWREGVDFVETGENLGVGGGYNRGISVALVSGADYVVLCNNDIVAGKDFVRSLREVFETTPDTAIAAPVMLYYGHAGRIWFAWVTQGRFLGYSINRLRGAPLASLGDRENTVFSSAYVPTCAAMISRAALEKTGLLDERFFFGHDDVDWCLRARRHGLHCRVLGRALVRHKVSVTSGIRGADVLTPSSAYTHATGSLLIGAKHYRGAAAYGFLLGLVAIRIPYNSLRMAMGGHWPSLWGYWSGIRDGFRLYGGAILGVHGVDDHAGAERTG